jgi:hypothetical protein
VRYRSSYRRNPEILGLDVARGVAAASGVYLGKNVGALLTSFLPGVAASVDSIRPGLSTGAMETIGAAITAGAIAPMLPISAQHKSDVTLGATAIAASDVIAALIGQVNLLQGTPSFGGMMGGAKAAPAIEAKAAAALPAPQNGYTNNASLPSGQAAQAQMSTSQLLGVGTMGF